MTTRPRPTVPTRPGEPRYYFCAVCGNEMEDAPTWAYVCGSCLAVRKVVAETQPAR